MDVLYYQRASIGSISARHLFAMDAWQVVSLCLLDNTSNILKLTSSVGIYIFYLASPAGPEDFSAVSKIMEILSFYVRSSIQIRIYS